VITPRLGTNVVDLNEKHWTWNAFKQALRTPYNIQFCTFHIQFHKIYFPKVFFSDEVIQGNYLNSDRTCLRCNHRRPKTMASILSTFDDI